MGTCKLPRCDQPVLPPGAGGRKKLFCSENHTAIGKQNNTVRYRASEQGREAALCANPSCNFLFVKRYLEHELCYHCERSGFVVSDRPKATEEMPHNDMSPQTHIDFRSKICNRKIGGLCRWYSKCSDSLGTHRHGAFKYQTNGGKDCWEEQEEGAMRVSYGSTASVHKCDPRGRS